MSQVRAAFGEGGGDGVAVTGESKIEIKAEDPAAATKSVLDQLVRVEIDPAAAWERVRRSNRPLARDEEAFMALFDELNRKGNTIVLVTHDAGEAAARGLDLTVDRSTPTLSPGELQRLRLATQIRSNLFGVVYVLDEPSAGLHPADVDRLMAQLNVLVDAGNRCVG